MPSRLIREGLLDSEAVLSLPAEARWVYVSILLTADDLGLFEATPFRIARKADIRREQADTMVELLVDRDLIRLYQVDGRQYGFIPRYGQRVQIRKPKYPLPPVALLKGDQDAIKKINDLASNPTVDSGDTSVAHGKKPPEAEAEAEAKEKQTPSLRSGEPAAAPPAPAKKPKAAQVEQPDDVDPQVWADWLQLRRKKSATVTPSVVAMARQEAQKAGMTFEAFLQLWVFRGSQGLVAEWVKPHERQAFGRAQPTEDQVRAQRRASNEEAKRILFGDRNQGVIDA